jgi:hypothetical protein
MPLPVDPDHHGEAAPPPRLHPGQGVLDHHGLLGRDAHPPGGLQEDGRVRLAREAQTFGLAAPDPSVEHVGHPGRLQDLFQVAAR